MNRTPTRPGTALVLTLLLSLAACGPTPAEPPGGEVPAAEPPAQVAAAPDTTGLVERAATRWDVISNDDWIQAYDFAPPEIRDQMPLSRFLQGKEEHRMRNPSAPELLGVEEGRAYVAVAYDWTPLHAQLMTADNLPPEGLTERLDTVESWIQVDGEWFFERNERRSEYDERRR